jgi:GNAT superfamily N-acetyltransferase
MKILTYRELESKHNLLPLLDHAFGWTFNPRTFETIVKTDPRLRHSPVGFFAVQNDNVIGSVGVMDMPTRTLDGSIEIVGGVYGVATLPSHVRKGVSTALMNAAHQYFKERGYRFSLLWTSRTFVAHAMYEKLGYVDWSERPTAHKILEPRKAGQAEKKKNVKVDFDQILKIYNRYTKSKAGFVIRDKAYMKMMFRFESLSTRDCIIEEDGYAVFKTNLGGTWVKGTWIRELVALNTQTMRRLLQRVEDKSKDLVYDRAIFDYSLLEVYESRGYMIRKKSHSVLMVKPLTPDVPFSRAYGDKFFLTSLDFF